MDTEIDGYVHTGSLADAAFKRSSNRCLPRNPDWPLRQFLTKASFFNSLSIKEDLEDSWLFIAEEETELNMYR